MKTLVIVNHPEFDNSATQNFLKESFPKNSENKLHVINDKFDVTTEQELLLDYNRIIFQFPLYWYFVPAEFKKWIDEVLDGNFIFSGDHPLENKEFGIVASTGISEKEFNAGGKENYSISEMFKPLEMMANKLHMRYLSPLVIYQFEYYGEFKKQELLVSYQQYIMQSNFTFNEKINWYVNELKNRNQDLLSSTLESKNDELNNLSWQVKMMREDDGEG